MFTIFNEKNEFLRTLNCDESDLFLNLQTGEKYLPGDYSNHYLVNNQPVQKPPCPSEYHNWDVTAKVWSADLEVDGQYSFSFPKGATQNWNGSGTEYWQRGEHFVVMNVGAGVHTAEIRVNRYYPNDGGSQVFIMGIYK